MIDSLMGPNRIVTETQDILRVVANYYKVLFGWESRGLLPWIANFGIDKVSSVENQELTTPFSEQEIKQADFDSYVEGAPGPDGLTGPHLSSPRFPEGGA
jgi:hypothetical protein